MKRSYFALPMTVKDLKEILSGLQDNDLLTSDVPINLEIVSSTISLERASETLFKHLTENGYPDWLSGIAITNDTIQVMLKKKKNRMLNSVWEGYRVEQIYVGQIIIR